MEGLLSSGSTPSSFTKDDKWMNKWITKVSAVVEQVGGGFAIKGDYLLAILPITLAIEASSINMI